MLQQQEPGDYVLATGESHSVREFVERAFALIDRHIEWKGTGPEEKGIDRATGQVLVEIDPRYFRPTEVEILVGIPGGPTASSTGSTRSALTRWLKRWSRLIC